MSAPAPGLISAELCLKFCDAPKIIPADTGGPNSDCLTVFLRIFKLGKALVIYVAFILFA